MTEQEWQTQVLDLAHLYRWMAHHTRPALNRRGQWATPIQGHPGFPDLVLCRGSRVLFVELKSERGLLTADQMAWRDRLLTAGMDWRCWRPKHWPEVQATLAPSPWSNLRLTEDVNIQGRVL